MKRRTLWLAVGSATAVLLAAAAPSVSAKPAQNDVIRTTLSVFDGPPDQGGRLRQIVPLEHARAGGDAKTILKNIPHPEAALRAGDVPASAANSGQPPAATAAVAAQDITSADCYANPASQNAPGVALDHLHYCRVEFLVITRLLCNSSGDCQTTGRVQWRSATIGRSSASGKRNVNFVTVFDQWGVTGDGASSSLTVSMTCTMTVGSVCNNEPGIANTYTRTIPNWISAPTVYFEFTSPMVGSFGLDKISQYNFKSVFTLIGANTLSSGSNTFRCDSATYLPSIAGGCVFPSVSELFKLRKSDQRVDETANHIERAQNSPLATLPPALFKVIPGKPGSGLPLERNYYDMNLRRLNRDTAVRACQTWFPLYPTLGQDCDEYPFATTFQGAANGNNYSVWAVTSSDNQLAGSDLSGFYGSQRILHDYDPFYVMILA